MFEGEAHRNYIQLCRHLRLERRPFRYGDVWCFWKDTPSGPFIQGASGNEGADEFAIWLPRLDQWYAMIRETWARGGGPSIDLYGDDETGFRCETDDRSATEHGEALTPEEAAARLWMAVTGRPVTSG